VSKDQGCDHAIMTVDLQTIFANLAERERIYGHHSPAGQAIRTLSRALNGWTTGSLSAVDVIVLCDQAIDDWLKARLKLSPWAAIKIPESLAIATEKKFLSPNEADRLGQMHRLRTHSDVASRADDQVVAALASCLEIVERYWS
jgi:hypothetical protein